MLASTYFHTMIITHHHLRVRPGLGGGGGGEGNVFDRCLGCCCGYANLMLFRIKIKTKSLPPEMPTSGHLKSGDFSFAPHPPPPPKQKKKILPITHPPIALCTMAKNRLCHNGPPHDSDKNCPQLKALYENKFPGEMKN